MFFTVDPGVKVHPAALCIQTRAVLAWLAGGWSSMCWSTPPLLE